MGLDGLALWPLPALGSHLILHVARSRLASHTSSDSGQDPHRPRHISTGNQNKFLILDDLGNIFP